MYSGGIDSTLIVALLVAHPSWSNLKERVLLAFNEDSQLENPDFIIEANLTLCGLLSSSGRYKEATDILNMSVSRFYSSCQNLYSGGYRDQVIGNVFDPNSIPAFLLFDSSIHNRKGEHISDTLNNTPIYQGIYQLWLALWVCGFYALFWSKGGQTLGMRAWRLKVQHPNGQNLSFITACARVVWSLAGIGNLYILLNSDKLALQDKLTRSEVVVLSVEANQMRNWHGA